MLCHQLKGPKAQRRNLPFLEPGGNIFDRLWRWEENETWVIGCELRAQLTVSCDRRTISIFNQSAHHFPSSVLLWLRLKESENMTVALEFRTFAVTALGFLGFYFTIKMLTGKRKGELNTQNSQAQWRTCRLIQEGLAPTLRVRSPPENRTRTTYSESLQLPL